MWPIKNCIVCDCDVRYKIVIGGWIVAPRRSIVCKFSLVFPSFFCGWTGETMPPTAINRVEHFELALLLLCSAPASLHRISTSWLFGSFILYSLILFVGGKLYCFQLTAKNIFIKTFASGKSLQQTCMWMWRPLANGIFRRQQFVFFLPRPVRSPSTFYHFLFQRSAYEFPLLSLLPSFSFSRSRKTRSLALPFTHSLLIHSLSHPSFATWFGLPVSACYLNCCNVVALHVRRLHFMSRLFQIHANFHSSGK